MDDMLSAMDPRELAERMISEEIERPADLDLSRLVEVVKLIGLRLLAAWGVPAEAKDIDPWHDDTPAADPSPDQQAALFKARWR